MGRGGTAGRGGSGTVHGVFATLTVLGCMCSLAWSVVSSASGARQTALLSFVLCGLVQAELAHRAGRSPDTPVVSAAAVWIIGAAVALPPVGVLAVAAVL